MNNVVEKKALKIKLESHSEFKKAWDALIKLGYHFDGQLTPHTAPYLYSYADGRILADFFDVEGADLSSPNSAFGYFTASEHKEVTLIELQSMAIWQEAPVDAWAWERFPNGKCVWHCRKDGKSFDKKAPNFKTEKSTLWRDLEKQKEADAINLNLSKSLSELNISISGVTPVLKNADEAKFYAEAITAERYIS